MRLNAVLDNWQNCSHVSDTSRDVLDVQCNFQLDSCNTSDLTASCVSVCGSDALRKWRNEISSSVTRSNFASNVNTRRQKVTNSSKGLMEDMPYQGHTFLGGIKQFWMSVRVWKTNLVLEDHARQKNGRKCDQSEGCCEG